VAQLPPSSSSARRVPATSSAQVAQLPPSSSSARGVPATSSVALDRRIGTRLFDQLKRLDPDASMEDYQSLMPDGAWDIEGMEDDIILAEKDRREQMADDEKENGNIDMVKFILFMSRAHTQCVTPLSTTLRAPAIVHGE